VPQTARRSLNRLHQLLTVALVPMLALTDLSPKNLDRIHSVQLLFDNLNFLPRVERQQLLLFLNICSLFHFLTPVREFCFLLLLRLFNPIKEWFFDKDLTGV